LRPLAYSLPCALSGWRLAVPPLPCHSRLPPLIRSKGGFSTPRNRPGRDVGLQVASATLTRSSIGFLQVADCILMNENIESVS
jgi:hypothetical protein